jgi:hypothetical protein
MRESISKRERVSQKSKVKGQIASREHGLRRAGLHGPPWRGVTTSAKATVVRRSFQRRRKPRPTYPTQVTSGFGRVVSIVASLLTAAPASALACPVCGLVGTSDNTWAYQAMSAMLTLLPLAMIGATVWWLARLVARADTERQSATQHVVDRDSGGLNSGS